MDKSVVSFPVPNHHTEKGLVTLEQSFDSTCVKVNMIITCKNSGKVSIRACTGVPPDSTGCPLACWGPLPLAQASRSSRS